MLGIKNTNLDPVLIKVLPSGIVVYMSPFKDIYGSRLIFAGPHRSFTKGDDGKRTEMSNAVFLIRQRIFQELEMELEEQFYSMRTNKKLGLTVNPYPINGEDIMDCNGEIEEELEDLLDNHEKLRSVLEDQENLCQLKRTNEMVKLFKSIIFDEGTIMDQLKPREVGNVDGMAEECKSPICDTNKTLDEEVVMTRKTTVRIANKEERMYESCAGIDQGTMSGNGDGIVEECNSRICDSTIALDKRHPEAWLQPGFDSSKKRF